MNRACWQLSDASNKKGKQGADVPCPTPRTAGLSVSDRPSGDGKPGRRKPIGSGTGRNRRVFIMALLTPDQVVRILERNKAAGDSPKTQTELAHGANISVVALNRWLRGSRQDIKLDTASRIADALGLQVVDEDGKTLS